MIHSSIGNAVAVQFASVISYLPLKFDFVSGGTYPEGALYKVLTNAIDYGSYNFEPTKSWALRQDVTTGVAALTTSVTQRVESLPASTPASAGGSSGSAIHTFGATFAKSLLTSGINVNVTSDILMGNGCSVVGAVGIVVCFAPSSISVVRWYTNCYGHQFAQVLDFYLKPENQTYWDQIVQLSTTSTPANDEILTKYILEASRLTTTLTSARDVNPADGKPITLVVDPAGTTVTLNKGDRVITSTVR